MNSPVEHSSKSPSTDFRPSDVADEFQGLPRLYVFSLTANSSIRSCEQGLRRFNPFPNFLPKIVTMRDCFQERQDAVARRGPAVAHRPRAQAWPLRVPGARALAVRSSPCGHGRLSDIGTLATSDRKGDLGSF